MNAADIRITAQYQENYSDTNIPYWKNKGGIEFIIPEVDSDAVMYAAPGETEEAIQRMLDKKSNEYARYTLITWEFIFKEPIQLDTDVFHKLMGIEV